MLEDWCFGGISWSEIGVNWMVSSVSCWNLVASGARIFCSFWSYWFSRFWIWSVLDFLIFSVCNNNIFLNLYVICLCNQEV